MRAAIAEDVLRHPKHPTARRDLEWNGHIRVERRTGKSHWRNAARSARKRSFSVNTMDRLMELAIG